MHNNKAFTVFTITLINAILLLITFPAHSAEGERLFQQYCSRCHQAAARIKSPPEQILTTLKTGGIRQHRFTLDEDNLQAIIDYIRQQKS